MYGLLSSRSFIQNARKVSCVAHTSPRRTSSIAECRAIVAAARASFIPAPNSVDSTGSSRPAELRGAHPAVLDEFRRSSDALVVGSATGAQTRMTERFDAFAAVARSPDRSRQFV
jgi:type IV pilus biogenesis protein CpaD/CtpE